MPKTTYLLLAALLGASLSSLSVAQPTLNASQAQNSTPSQKNTDAALCDANAIHATHAVHHQEIMQHMRAMQQMHTVHHPDDTAEIHVMPHPHHEHDMPGHTF